MLSETPTSYRSDLLAVIPAQAIATSSIDHHTSKPLDDVDPNSYVTHGVWVFPAEAPGIGKQSQAVPFDVPFPNSCPRCQYSKIASSVSFFFKVIAIEIGDGK